jgi:hypothetical protein
MPALFSGGKKQGVIAGIVQEGIDKAVFDIRIGAEQGRME